MGAKKLKSGAWNVIVYDYTDDTGKRHYKSFTHQLKAQAEYEASQFRLEKKHRPSNTGGITLYTGIDRYIESKSNILSPSTIRGYRYTQRLRYKDVMHTPIECVSDWQSVINEEAKLHSAKTVKNDWMLVCAVMRTIGITPPTVTLPQIVKNPLPFLSAEQIPTLLDAVKDSNYEMAVLLGLHSLRRSEILAVTKEDCSDGVIRVRGSMVFDENDNYVAKDTNKNVTSNRDVPIMIPRLQALIDNAPTGKLVTGNVNALRQGINRVCRDAGLPEIGIHGLRRSFASLGYSLGLSERTIQRWGGWADLGTLHKFYIQLSDADMNHAKNEMSDFYAKMQNEDAKRGLKT